MIEFLKFFLAVALAVAAIMLLGFVAESLLHWYERAFPA